MQAPGLSAQERDRRAILAMAGSYRVTFDFLEIASYSGDGARPRPYQSWGTEKVYVDRNEPGFVSLVHILEMRIVDGDGKTSEPMVTKHWRQDWRFEPAYVIENADASSWKKRELSRAERRGAWSQQVFQVDESPRYGSIGRWEHNAAFSSWISGDTARRCRGANGRCARITSCCPAPTATPSGHAAGCRREQPEAGGQGGSTALCRS